MTYIGPVLSDSCTRAEPDTWVTQQHQTGRRCPGENQNRPGLLSGSWASRASEPFFRHHQWYLLYPWISTHDRQAPVLSVQKVLLCVLSCWSLCRVCKVPGHHATWTFSRKPARSDRNASLSQAQPHLEASQLSLLLLLVSHCCLILLPHALDQLQQGIPLALQDLAC